VVAASRDVLIEAESFAKPGGWVVDQQFMDQMVSPMLMAHGLGEPVEDATAVVELPLLAEYRVFVRTRGLGGAVECPGRRVASNC